MLKNMFPNLSKIAAFSLSIPVATASVERKFSQDEVDKSCCLSDTSLSHLMKIMIESPNTLDDCDLKELQFYETKRVEVYLSRLLNSSLMHCCVLYFHH